MRPLASPCLVTWANFVEFHAAIRTPVRVCCDPALKYLNQLHLIIKEGGKGKKAKKKRKARAQKCRVSYMYAASNLKFIGRMRLTFQILFHISGVALVK